MGASKIEWTEQTWNPIIGCSIVSPGCTNCYAMKMAARTEAMGISRYDGMTRKVNGNAIWTGKLARAPRETLLAPLKRRKPTTYFVNSMGDLFHEDCPDEWIDEVFAVMALCPQHTFQVLTKRAARMRDYCASDATLGRVLSLTNEWLQNDGTIEIKHLPDGLGGIMLPNVWLGVSAERQQEANERVPLLLSTPAAVRFVSCEPLLDHVALHALNLGTDTPSDALRGARAVPDDSAEGYHNEKTAKLDWVIVGGESGAGARPMHPTWASDIRDWCAATNVAFFFKQWGEWGPCSGINVSMKHALCGALASEPHIERDWTRALDFLKKSKGVSGTAVLARMGKISAGRALDGKRHDAMPPRAAHGTTLAHG